MKTSDNEGNKVDATIANYNQEVPFSILYILDDTIPLIMLVIKYDAKKITTVSPLCYSLVKNRQAYNVDITVIVVI